MLNPIRVIALLVVMSLLGIVVPGQAVAAEPETPVAVSSNPSAARLVKFSGTLRDSSGAPLTGTMGLTLAIYKMQQGGSPLWMETQNVSLDAQGNYSVLLGLTQSEGLPLELFSTGESRWLGVQAQLSGAEEQMRVLLVSVPYALKAADADTLGGKPLSAFVLAAPTDNTGEQAPSTLDSGKRIGNQVPTKAALTTAAIQSASYLAEFDPACTKGCTTTLVNSPLFASSGNVGIGTTAPGYKLDVQGGQLNASGGLCIAGVCNLSGPVGTVTAVNTGVGSGLTGGGTNGSLNLAMTAAARTRVITYLGGCDNCSILTNSDSQHLIYQDLIGAMTINSVTCYSDAGNPIINIARNGTNIVGSNATTPANLTCSTTGAASSAILTAQSTMSLNDKLDFNMITADGVAKRVTVIIVAMLN